ncbi:Sua5/YciO/YrdC/YwlC family protein [Psychrobacter sp. 72-O-c]|uniref:Sua5/YciO/YrdC/YwlC family protein n=1 Tax=Psychrobacter sp. 72-O-c TaxID=2774125 RepID=UPI00191B3B73|nr:Sua5/YciO/YrdC/YwlC family protein [Psychrobacter sp. 72-O-c]
MLPVTALTTNSVTQATQCLKVGQLLTYPTESVWGIGCDPFNQLAVQQLLAIKQRPMDKGMIVVTDSAARIAPLLESLSAEQRQTVLDSWHISPNVVAQQAHTWLLPLSQPQSSQSLSVPIPSWITGAHDSVAVRVIAHPLIQQLCAQMVSASNPYGFIVSTSCNPSGQPPALSLAQAQGYFINSEFAQQVAYLQGDTLGYELPSQIHDALTGQVIR